MFQRTVGVLGIGLVIVGISAAAEPARLGWEKAEVGQLPPGWQATTTGAGPGSVWKILADPAVAGGKVLAQLSAEGPKPLFNLCVAQHTRYTDVDVSVAFKAVDGRIDQGGGPVWRYQDANNYYIARMNPLEDNFRLYKVIGGKRVQLASEETEAKVNRWHTIRVVHQGEQIRVYLDGKPLLEAKDNAIRGPGKIGLWTKADAQTHFADLKVEGK